MNGNFTSSELNREEKKKTLEKKQLYFIRPFYSVNQEIQLLTVWRNNKLEFFEALSSHV